LVCVPNLPDKGAVGVVHCLALYFSSPATFGTMGILVFLTIIVAPPLNILVGGIVPGFALWSDHPSSPNLSFHPPPFFFFV